MRGFEPSKAATHLDTEAELESLTSGSKLLWLQVLCILHHLKCLPVLMMTSALRGMLGMSRLINTFNRFRRHEI